MDSNIELQQSKDAVISELAQPDSGIGHPSDKVYAWRRFLARAIDYQISAVILSGFMFYTPLLPTTLINALNDETSPPMVTLSIWGFFEAAQWVVLESVLLLMIGSTPGKVLLGLKLVSIDGKRQYWKRSFAVWIIGIGLALPLISPFACLISGLRAKRNRITDWDKWSGFKVDAQPFGIGRALIVTILIALILVNRSIFMDGLGRPNTVVTQSAKVDNPQAEVVKNNPQDDLKMLRFKAMQGDALAQSSFGVVYQEGIGVPQDYQEAVKWFLLSAEQGNSDAQNNLGSFYQLGQGVPQDYQQAVKWYRLSAEQGNSMAQFNLGLMYYMGKGVPKDYQEAAKWFRLSAEQGHSLAQYRLGTFYDFGQGVPQDYQEAVKWYRLSAEQGNSDAQNNLGSFYQLGQGVPQDYQQAVKWFRLSAEQGNSMAQFNLGVMYVKGEGVIQDYVYGHMWFNLAASSGGSEARHNRELVTEEMTPGQIAEAQILARKCLNSNYKDCGE